MSWYNRKPRRNEPNKHHLAPHHTSPLADKMMEEAKKTGPSETVKVKKFTLKGK